MKKVFILVMALAVMVSASIYAQDRNRDDDRRPDDRGRGDRVEKRDDHRHQRGGERIDMSKLSEAQRKEIKTINDKYKIDLSNFSLDIKKQNNVIKAEMMKDSPDKATIDAAIDAKSSLEAQMAKMKFEKMLAIKAVVKPASPSAQ